jgi:RHS repeat-associated protein
LDRADGNSNIAAEYTWDALGRPVTMTKGGVTYYYHVNGHGDVVALTDASGNVVAQYQYDAWGNILSKTGALATANPYRYAGYYYDEETGLYYLMARYYDANMGRFITRDTFHGFENEPLSINQYVYTKNNPVIYVDINGHFAFLLVPLAGVSISWLTAAAAESTAIVIAYVAANEIVSVLERKFNRKNPTVIYRTGSGNSTNLTPRPKDVSGLSYTTVKPLSGPYTATTIEAINATGKLVAIKDGKTHVSVRPVNMKKMQGWINSRENANTRPHEYTKLLQALSVKVK